MADKENIETAPEIELESSTYEIIRNRLNGFADDLQQRLDQLNASRKEVFGSIDTVLTTTERITTEHNCVPRDMVAIGRQFIFGYNVQFGLKTETHLGDVFAVYEFQDGVFHEKPLDLLTNAGFQRDFTDLYRYYKEPVFAKFFLSGVHLFMVFRVGKNPNDVKTFKWLVRGESLEYVDNRSDHEYHFPPQHEFQWLRTHRDLHRAGDHPHISIEDRVFVETVGGDLTIKIEDNTASGQGIYSEDVEQKDQTLDDADVYYAIVGNIILLKIRPYKEERFRYIVFNEKITQAQRLDAVEHACVLLPDDHGLIFSNGYYLQSGENKTFESDLADMLFERRLAAPNGEDYLYVFYNRHSGTYILLRYNLIEQKVETPIVCHGFTLFDGGELVCFKSQHEPQKHHVIQLWQTPYVGEDYIPHTNTESYLYKIGNRDLVRGMAECHEVIGLIGKEDTYANLYVDLVKKSTDILDSYFWINHKDTAQLSEPLKHIREAASAAVEEFDKVVRVRKNTTTQTDNVRHAAKEILNAVHRKRLDKIEDFVTSLADMRRVRGDIISLRELRYVDLELVNALEQEVAEQTEKLADRCVQFLLKPDALSPYAARVEEQAERIKALAKVSDAKKLEDEIAKGAAELEMLIEIVSNLKIDDATQRTAIIDNISTIFSKVNSARAALKNKNKELLAIEGVAEFSSQMKLLNQGVVNYLDICDTPEKCEEFLTKVMIQIEELEGRFAEFDEFVLQLTEKREEIYNAFETRKLALIEARNKRANSLMAAAGRILKGIKTRVDNMESINDINGYFAADLMIEKLRDLTRQLTDLDDTVKVDDIQSRLKTIREDAVRQLKDRQELFVDGDNVIRFGKHLFSVNVQALDLTTVLRDGVMNLHLTGTNFFEPVRHEAFLATRDVWDQEMPSENRDVYRGEFLCHKILQALGTKDHPTLETVARMDEAQRVEFVRRFMGPRYSEGYSKGVHDQDAARILKALVEMQSTIGLLRFDAGCRAMAVLFWRSFGNRQQKSHMEARLQGFGTVTQAFPAMAKQSGYIAELQRMLDEFNAEYQLFDQADTSAAAEYLFCELTTESDFCVSRRAAELLDAFHSQLRASGFTDRFQKSINAVKRAPASSFKLLKDWATAFASTRGNEEDLDYVDEVAVQLMQGHVDPKWIVDGHVSRVISQMVGSHPRISQGKYHLHYNHFVKRLDHYDQHVLPRYHRYIELKKEIVDAARDDMRLDEFRPRVLTSFVRNKLIDTVYLPIVGDNLAKQIGVVGESKRTDLMGLLLLVSPPGYGKTTLMEYIANRLGIIFMKINGPAIGHQVTSLDPSEATNAAAREEIEKLNLSLEMGDNVMIYIDDIQHCNPEFLQKFISLCDAQRKIEGVYKGRTRTYDLRGRKVCVVMAGNPYTESGEKFQIPDMLSNRADIYNLGEIIGDSAEAFELSYLENSLTSNPVLNKLATRSQKDVYAIVKMAQHGQRDGVELEGNYSLEELNEFVAVMKKLLRVRDVVLRVNREYIRSAAQSDEYRTEPAFKLQGSYRNMNRIAEKVVAIMNDQELQTLILSNYENDAQTLTSDTESNLLKLREMLGILTDAESRRWHDIKRTFQQNLKMKGIESDDEIAQVLVQLSTFNDGLDHIRQALIDGVKQLVEHDQAAEDTEREIEVLIQQVGGLKEGLQSIGREISNSVSPENLSLIANSLRPEPASPQTVQIEPLDPATIEQRVIVQHRVPKNILNVMSSQFELMRSWLEPVFRASQEQRQDIEELRKSLELCLDNYSVFLHDLNDARAQKNASKDANE